MPSAWLHRDTNSHAVPLEPERETLKQITRPGVRPPAYPPVSLLWWLPAALLPVLLIGLVAVGDPPAATADDFGQYLSHATALVEGRPYTDIGFIHTPLNNFIGPPAEPPGYPVLLAGVFAISGPGYDVAKLLGVVSLLLFLALAWLFLSHSTSPVAATVAVSVAGVAIVLTEGLVPNPDLPFAAALWGVFLLLDRPSTPRPAAWAVALLCGAMAISFRSAAIVLIPMALSMAVLESGTSRRRYLLLAASWGVVFTALVVSLPTVDVFAREIELDPLARLAPVFGNALGYARESAIPFLYPFPWNAANDVYHTITLILLAVGGVRWTQRSWRTPLFWFVVWYGAMLLTFPAVVARYLWWFYPGIVALAVEGVRTLWRARPTVRLELALPMILTLVTLAGVGTRLWWMRPPDPEVVAGVAELEAASLAVATTHPVRALTHVPRKFTWNTNIPAMGPFEADPRETLAELCRRRISHLILVNFDVRSLDLEAIRETVALRPAYFREIFRNPHGAVFQYLPMVTGAPSCETVASTQHSPG